MTVNEGKYTLSLVSISIALRLKWQLRPTPKWDYALNHSLTCTGVYDNMNNQLEVESIHCEGFPEAETFFTDIRATVQLPVTTGRSAVSLKPPMHRHDGQAMTRQGTWNQTQNAQQLGVYVGTHEGMFRAPPAHPFPFDHSSVEPMLLISTRRHHPEIRQIRVDKWSPTESARQPFSITWGYMRTPGNWSPPLLLEGSFSNSRELKGRGRGESHIAARGHHKLWTTYTTVLPAYYKPYSPISTSATGAVNFGNSSVPMEPHSAEFL
ncbi:hypothetical protein EDD16DRAFT_1527854 [Pisolithus croceorrhizus]|nr:hypothetical protein EDD16DRAFT_1527854 [Pisolithus croceorrhizus]KAI6156211.1 hypothetical protein EDD17DRAFT_1512669 [Pisolithus thermaeus]